MTQRDLAFPGCTAAYISRIEAGARVPSYQILREFARRLGVSADYLATGANDLSENDPLFAAELAARLGDKAEAEAMYRAMIDGGRRELLTRAQAGLGLMPLRTGTMSPQTSPWNRPSPTCLCELTQHWPPIALGGPTR